MDKTQRRLRWFGGVGLAAGLLLALAAPLGGAELAGMLRGYGVMLAGAALYLLAGQWLIGFSRERRATARATTEQVQHSTPQV
ncbi:MAG TPA: hypothetical protein VFX74_03515 [Candidatus Limnocylindria bacterium]|nr:hypothetical protein [Candidatus Limnocylindria bacterium]